MQATRALRSSFARGVEAGSRGDRTGQARVRRIVLNLCLAYQNSRDEYDGVMQYLNEHGLDWEIVLERENLTLRQWRRRLREGIDGVLSDDKPADGVFRDWSQSLIPLVVVNFRHASEILGRTKNLAAVISDENGVGRMAARELLACESYRSFGFVAMPWSDEREQGFADGLSSAGRTYAHLDDERLEAQLRALPKPAAVFVACDRKAADVLSACRRQGLRVPEEIAVLGVDNELFTCRHTRPTLSSVRLDFKAAGYAAARAMHALLQHRRPARTVIYHALEVVHRSSTAAPSTAGSIVEKARDLIRLHAQDCDFDIGELARMMKISRRLLDRRFVQVANRTPHQELDAVRLGLAADLLRTTSMNVCEIAEASGFSSHAYFARRIRAAYGVTPQAFRADAKKLK